jgi:hypothetical protein
MALLILLLEYVAADSEAAIFCQNGFGMSFVGHEPAQNG